MGRKCNVPECLSEEGRSEDEGVTFHKIPMHSDIRPKWMSLCHIPEDKKSVKVVYVCSRHFLRVDFCSFKGRKYMLRQGVLPSVFPWNKTKGDLKDRPNDDTNNVKAVKSDTDREIKNTVPSQSVDKSSQKCIDVKQEIAHENNDNVKTDTVRSLNTLDNVNVKEELMLSVQSTTIEQRVRSSRVTSTGVINFAPNNAIEVLHFDEMWYPAHIIEVDFEDSEVLIHFDKDPSKDVEWISFNSARLRAASTGIIKTATAAPIEDFSKKSLLLYETGERCMASWSDSRKFPATVTRVIDADTYEVLFDDGFVKVLKAHRMMKTQGKAIHSAPLFDPAQGTKQERRDRKRKINVAALFGKRSRSEIQETQIVSPVSAAPETVLTITEETEHWAPSWENGRPVGTESVIEFHDGTRKSIIVADPRLPPSWVKHFTQRGHGASTAGKWDVVIVNPDGRRFRTRAEIKIYLEDNPQLKYAEAMFDFSLNRRPRKAVNLDVRRLSQTPDVSMSQSPTRVESGNEEDENTNSLKIPLVDNAYICPIEGCGKNFRRENLAQMHVKHYHPEYTKFLDSTPNVADLAYARTVGESLDRSPGPEKTKTMQIRQMQKTVTSKSATPKSSLSAPVGGEPENKTGQTPMASQTQSKKDSEIIKLLNSKPVDEPDLQRYPSGLPASMYPDIKLRDLLSKSEGIPKRDDINLKTLITTRPTGIKTLLPVVRQTEPKRDIKLEENQFIDPEAVIATHSVSKSSQLRQNFKRKRQVSDNTELMKPRDIPEVGHETPASAEQANYIVEGGEVIKIVRMRSEEIINCTCGITEEDGLMIQCELCMCWQHAYCNNIEREVQVPDNYVCYICLHPFRQRSSRKYYHDQEWLKQGTLPVAGYHCKDEEMLRKRFTKLKKTHDVSGSLIELREFARSLRRKIKIAEAKNHPKLYLWSKPWEKLPLPEKQEPKAILNIKQETSGLNRNDLDVINVKTEPQTESVLFSILKSGKDEQKLKDEFSGLSKLDINSLIEEPLQRPIVPQPEAAINSTDCRFNLIDHIAHSQLLVEERLNDIEQQIDALDKQQEDNDAHTRQTIKMLLRDLNTLKELEQNNSL